MGFIARGVMDLQRHLLIYSGNSSCIIGILSLYVFVGFCLGRGCWVGVTMIASGLLDFCRCCALRLEGKSQVGITPICISSEGRMMPCHTIVALPASSACTSRQAPCVLVSVNVAARCKMHTLVSD